MIMQSCDVLHQYKVHRYKQNTLINYTSADQEILFEKSNFQYGYERYQLIRHLTAELIPPAPGVNAVHMFGTDINTASNYQY